MYSLKNKKFLCYTIWFFCVLALATIFLCLAFFNFYPALMTFGVLVVTISWGFLIPNHLYIKTITPLAKKPFDKKGFWTASLKISQSFGYLLVYAISMFFLLLGLSKFIQWFLVFLEKKNISIETLELGFFGLAILLLVIVCGLGAFVFKKLKTKITSFERKQQPFSLFPSRLLCMHGLASLRCFFRQSPSAKTNPLVVFLAFLSLLGYVTPVLPIIALVSSRWDNGLSFACFCWVCLVTTYMVTTPIVQAYVIGHFGPKSLRLLGWNGPEQVLLKYTVRGTVILVGAKIATTGGGILVDGLDNLRATNQDNLDAQRTANRNKNITAANNALGIEGHTPLEQVPPKRATKWPWQK
jgi:hypothetical protein